ncbi:MAG: hypothetical protein Q8K69_11015 [Bacteroidota bacterium]|nr:hypothetical protein [Bacteroidota bacterium]
MHLKGLGKIPHELIAEITGVSPNTMRTYFKEYETGGIGKLKQINFYQPQSKLVEHKTSIEQYFRDNPSGRVRYNVLGAIDAVSHNLITVCNNGYINAQSVCELLLKIYKQNIDIPITIVLDNARYQRCEVYINFINKFNHLICSV